MFIKYGKFLILISALFLTPSLMHGFYLSSLYSCKATFWVDAHYMPTPAGYLKTSDGKKVYCVKIPPKPWKMISFPFAPDHAVRCTQANASSYGNTHFYINTLYAIDLASLLKHSAGTIYASFEGTALVQDGCTHGQFNAANACSCNQGFGNNVRIVQEDGTYALYAHLSSIDVKNGELVIAGQRIGIEGSSGAAGHRHLHFSIHKTDNPQELELYQTPGISIPFAWNIRNEKSSDYQEISSLDMRKSNAAFYGQRELDKA